MISADRCLERTIWRLSPRGEAVSEVEDRPVCSCTQDATLESITIPITFKGMRFEPVTTCPGPGQRGPSGGICYSCGGAIPGEDGR